MNASLIGWEVGWWNTSKMLPWLDHLDNVMMYSCIKLHSLLISLSCIHQWPDDSRVDFVVKLRIQSTDLAASH